MVRLKTRLKRIGRTAIKVGTPAVVTTVKAIDGFSKGYYRAYDARRKRKVYNPGQFNRLRF